MFTAANKINKTMNREFIRLFGKAKSLGNFDELNVINHSYGLYRELDEVARKGFNTLARRVYLENGGKELELDIIVPYLLGILHDYNPVTKYIYSKEVDRKRSRYAESVIASPTKVKEIDRALRLWANMVTQYTIDITDVSYLQAYKDIGYTEVEWVTEEDDRVCEICEGRNGKVYPIDKVPAKPHIGCRCYFIPKLK